MSSLIKSHTPKTPEISPVITSTTPEVEAAGEMERWKAKKRKGYKSTILTGQEGLTEGAPVSRETLGT